MIFTLLIRSPSNGYLDFYDFAFAANPHHPASAAELPGTDFTKLHFGQKLFGVIYIHPQTWDTLK
jgi:hypothetical protein